MTKPEEAQLRESIKRFGMVDPIVANSAPDRFNVVIGGHQRLKVLKGLKWETVPVVYVEIPDQKQERELNLRLNKNTGHFDLDLLKEFEQSMLREVGFSDQELEKIFDQGDGGDGVEPEVPFGRELLESQNYLILAFDNELDWLRLTSLFPLRTVKSSRSRAGWEQKGMGRVVNGSEFLDTILGSPEEEE
jgi:hypothetical protein